MTVENVDYIFLQYYFDKNVHEVDINAPHGNAKRLKKPHRRAKESVKGAARKVKQDIFLEHGGFQNVHSPRDFPKHRKQVSILRYFGDPSNRRDRGDIVEIFDMSQDEVANNKYIRNVLMAPEKIISLMTNRQLNDIVRFCSKPYAISVLGIDPTYNLGPCHVAITTYRHLLFSTEDDVLPVMLGPALIHTKKCIHPIFNFQAKC